VLLRWRPTPHARLLPRETLGLAMAAGLRYVAQSPAIRTVLGRSAVFGLAASAVMALLPLIAKLLIGGGPLTYGLLLGAFGFGAVAGAIAAGKLRKFFSTEAIVRGACIAFALAAVVAAASHQLALTMGVLTVAGAAWVLALSTFNVAVQLSAPRWVVARALSLYQMAAFGGIAAGSWLWGEIAERANVSTALLVAAALMLGCAWLGRWLALAQLEELDLDPLRQWREPTTAVPVEQRTGPVVITIEYRIREDDIIEFLAAMADRRRIRRRDGARSWRLLRDLGDPQVWIERYETPTWLEYVRHNSRITKDDAYIPQRLRGLHQGPGDPRVRRMIERQTSTLPTGYQSPRDLAEPVTDTTRSS
jgi:hypothetical protein